MLNFTKKEIFFSIIIATPIVFFYINLFYYTFNIPISDDFDSPLNTILRLNKSNGLKEIVKILFEFHADHRVFFLRLESLVFLCLSGDLNFKFVTLFNDCLLLIVFFILVKPLWLKNKLLEILIISTSIFILIYEDALLWAHVSSNYSPVLLFAMLSFYLVTRSKCTPLLLILSFFSCIMASLSFGNGILTFIVIGILLAIQSNYKYVILWMIGSALFLKLYFWGYVRPDYLGKTDYFGDIITKVKSIFFLLGGVNIIGQNMILWCILLGSFLSLTGVYIVFDNKKKIFKDGNNLLYGGFLLFCVGTIVAICLGRITNEDEFRNIINSRYRFYSVFFLSSILLLLLYNYNFKNWILCFLAFFMFSFNFCSFFKNKHIFDYRIKEFQCELYNWKNNKSGLFYYLNQEKVASERLTEFSNLGYFKSDYSSIFNNWKNLKIEGHKNIQIEKIYTTRRFGKYVVNDFEIKIAQNDFNLSSTKLNGMYFIFKSETKKYIIPGHANPYLAGRNILKNGTGVNTIFNARMLNGGKYEVLILIKQPNSLKLYSTNTVVEC